MEELRVEALQRDEQAQQIWKARKNDLYEEQIDLDKLGYNVREQGNWRNRGPLTSDTRDAEIEAILNQVPTKLESTKSSVYKTRRELSSMDHDTPLDPHKKARDMGSTFHSTIRVAEETSEEEGILPISGKENRKEEGS
ncbi:hypothetical protein HAX54_053040 [Datura stramonium]|uniref:Uncharacterized protein n=1 Tax=Datura stramonium TaxID=4076 RepID=A0ABS8WP70_DATST|nr:hypothetical protein [Datura stramonium]